MELWGLRVMVVGDDQDALGLMQSALCAAGAELVVETLPGSALSTLAGVCPEVLLVNVATPGLELAALMARVRALCPEKGGRVPAAAILPRNASPALVDVWSGAGFQALIGHPLVPATLVATVLDLSRTTVDRRKASAADGTSRNRRWSSRREDHVAA